MPLTVPGDVGSSRGTAETPGDSESLAWLTCQWTNPITSHAEPSTWGREIHLLLTGGTARSHGQGHRCGVAASGACDLRGDTRAPHAFGSMLCCQLHKILTNVPLTWSPTLIFHWVLQISQAVLGTGERTSWEQHGFELCGNMATLIRG